MHMSKDPLPTLHRLRQNPIIRLLSSLWFGITLLALITAYAAFISAYAPLRFELELTEMEAFRHWFFVALIGLLCLSIIVATLTRIRFTIVNAGVLTVHTGILVLCAGSLWYFGTKIEGSVRLDSPRIELISTGGMAGRAVASVLAEQGQQWSATMPAVGGKVSLEVLDARGAGFTPVSSARVRVQIGAAAAREFDLTAAESPVAPISNSLALRLVTFGAKDTFYDKEIDALHYGRAGESSRHVAPIAGLPHYRERYLDEGYQLRDSLGREVVSHRTTPAIDLWGLKIPTGWFERWRMPIRLNTPELPFDVTITGFVSYVADIEERAFPGGIDAPLNPVARLRLQSDNGVNVAETLAALDPERSLGRQLNIEFRWCRSAEEQAALLAPLAGVNELTIEVVDPPLRKTIAIEAGQTIPLEGAGYELKIVEILPSWPLMSPGFEKARSPVARIDVTRGNLKYNRTVVQRFPQFTQDIDAQGKRHREGPVDPNLKLSFRTAAQNWALLTAGPGLPNRLAFFTSDGRTIAADLTVGKPQELDFGAAKITATLEQLVAKAREVALPVVEARERRRSEGLPAIRVRLDGRGALKGWSESRWLVLNQYPEVPGGQMLRISPPGGDEFELVFAPYVRPLDFGIALRKLSAKFFPGGVDPTTWQSDFLVREGSGADSGHVAVNQTAAVGRWTLFQASAAPDAWSYTVLGVGNRRGVWLQVLGCILITLGCLYAFYVKPALKRRQLEQARRRAAALLAASAAREVPAEAPV